MLSVNKLNQKSRKNGGVEVICELSNGIIQRSVFKYQGENVFFLIFNQKIILRKDYFESEEGKNFLYSLAKKELKELE